MTMIERTLSVIVLPDGDDIFTERGTIIKIDDESGGEFVSVSQEATPGYGKIAFNPEEWPTIRAVIDRMVGECRS